MKKALEDADFELIKEYVLEGKENALPEQQRNLLDRWICASSLLEKSPVMKDAARVMMVKYGIGRTQAYEDCHNAVRFFGSRKDFDYDLWRNWLLKDIVDLCSKAKEAGDYNAWARAQANLIKAIGEAPQSDLDPRLVEKQQIVIPIQVNNSTYNIDLKNLLKIPVDMRKQVTDALIHPADDKEIEEIINT